MLRRTSTALGSTRSLIHCAGDTVAVLGVDQDAVGERFDPVAEVADLRQRDLAFLGGVEPQLDDLPAGVLGDEFTGRALGDDAAHVHDHEPVAQLLGLVHVVRGQHERDALALELPQPLPHEVARLRVEAGGRLVEKQQVGLVDQGPRDGEPSLHAAGERVDLVAFAIGELHEVEQFGSPGPDVGQLEPEVPAVDQHVVPDGQLGIEVVLLRHHAEPGADRAGRRVPDPSRARGGGRR